MATFLRAMGTTRRGFGRLCAGAGFGLLAILGAYLIALDAFACTAIMGALTISPTSGNAGSTISTSASGLKAAPAKYNLLFEDSVGVSSGGSCMGSPHVLVANIPTDTQGAWNGVIATIPSNAPQGVSEVCGMESYPVRGATGTTHDTYTILGGGSSVPLCAPTENAGSIWKDPYTNTWFECRDWNNNGQWFWGVSTAKPPACNTKSYRTQWTNPKTGTTYTCTLDISESYVWVPV